MTALLQPRHRYTYQEYLAYERDSAMKHEFVHGEIGVPSRSSNANAFTERRQSAQRSAAVSAAGEAASSPPLADAGETPARQPAGTPALRWLRPVA